LFPNATPLLVPVLTYHGANVGGNDYASNDHLAFFDDLRLLHREGFRIIRLDSIVATLRHGGRDLSGTVGISMDDGTAFDYHDLPHPLWGVQRSMLNIMKDFVDEFGPQAQPELHATSFVIASPDARRELDTHCLVGRDWYTDDWWPDAIASGLMSIANHSWDHNHPAVGVVAQRNQEKGTFSVIDTFEEADAQIRQAAEYLSRKTAGKASRLFAYPYGQFNSYLTDEYLPRFGAQNGIEAAFTVVPDMISETSGRWTLPRLVCGDAWKNSDELCALLASTRG
jgi:Polysaccharide deacetylase